MSKQDSSTITTVPDLTSPEAQAKIQQQLQQHQQLLSDFPADGRALDRATILLDIADAEIGSNSMQQAWNHAREALTVFIEHDHWQAAVEACHLLYQTEQAASIVALGQGVWLAVTFPVELSLSLNMLTNIIEETPGHSDGAAVAAMTAHYIADIRSDESNHQSMTFLTNNILARVAERHSNITTQQALEIWLAKLELKQPEDFLPRMGKIIDIMVGDNWWFDRDKLRAKIPH